MNGANLFFLEYNAMEQVTALLADFMYVIDIWYYEFMQQFIHCFL